MSCAQAANDGSASPRACVTLPARISLDTTMLIISMTHVNEDSQMGKLSTSHAPGMTIFEKSSTASRTMAASRWSQLSMFIPYVSCNAELATSLARRHILSLAVGILQCNQRKCFRTSCGSSDISVMSRATFPSSSRWKEGAFQTFIQPSMSLRPSLLRYDNMTRTRPSKDTLQHLPSCRAQ